MFFCRIVLNAIFVLLSLILVACNPPPSTPSLSMDVGIKQLQFSWAAVSDTTFYRLLENPDGAPGLHKWRLI